MRRTLRAVTSTMAVILVTAWLVLVGAAPVSAGGTTWTFDREHYQPGDTAFAWSAIARGSPCCGSPPQPCGPRRPSPADAESSTGGALDLGRARSRSVGSSAHERRGAVRRGARGRARRARRRARAWCVRLVPELR